MTEYSADWVLPVDGPPIRDGFVAVEGGRVVEVGEGRRGEDFGAAAILPGFVNAHTHIEYAVYAGFGDGQSFGPWLATHIERKSRIDFEDMVAIARWGAACSLASGVTTIADASFSGAAAVACAEVGLRGIVCLEVFGREADAARAMYEAARERIDGRTGDVTIGISPHAPYTCSDEVYAMCAELGVPIITHFNESRNELEWLRHGRGPMTAAAEFLVPPDGRTGIERVAPLLGPTWIAAHCVHVSPDEIAILAQAEVGVAHCPRSNGYLGCGFAPVAELRAAGLRVGVGTDGVSSTPSHDFFEELRTAAVVARARSEDADAVTGARALELGTLESARALSLDGEVGSLTPGKRADLAVVSLAGSPWHPWEDPAAAVVFGGSPERVLLTVVDGEERYRKGVTTWHELSADASSVRSRLLGLSAAAPRGARPSLSLP